MNQQPARHHVVPPASLRAFLGLVLQALASFLDLLAGLRRALVYGLASFFCRALWFLTAVEHRHQKADGDDRCGPFERSVHGVSWLWGSVKQYGLLADFMPDHAAHRSATDRPDSAPARQHGAAHCANARTDRGAFILRRHPRTAAQSQQAHGSGNRGENSLFDVHDATF
ncbi:hypothetical protein THICB1_110236 [Thiomonas arsenitoxydans]|uniref:Transposase n=1 Tax=Thiomonas arsenitoxydans (strain DSM 22701 / CIP 110005 / 3As) TaxID=426114 RepID=A0ABM9T410_THIA3|nr:hypothetical protein THICB1_110236 [Thiomonas arsenitoxydans]CQR30169.1 hypothetical protein THICB6_150301 [Thiomonas arsenitoxydans]